jgi:hypothetical protein
MEWEYNGKPVTDEMTEGYIGFVYVIRNTTNDRLYIGKKRLIRKVTKPPLKGSKRKRRSIVPSDWRDYYGSNDDLLSDVAELGSDKFERKIIRFCKTLAECSYFEAKEQFTTDAILNERYYNKWIMCKIRADHLKSVQLST